VGIVVRTSDPTQVVIELPGLVFPVEIARPENFDPDDLSTWPGVEGRLELVGGRLLYMPPTGRIQSRTVSDVVIAFADWARRHPEFALASNEAGMKLGDDVRGADVGVWRAADLAGGGHQVASAPPILAVEVAGRDDTEEILLDKASWYLDHGVVAVWILLPEQREVVAVTADERLRFDRGSTLPAIPELSGLSVAVSDLFRQLDAG
jgi:Uma2 family endonuclease